MIIVIYYPTAIVLGWRTERVLTVQSTRKGDVVDSTWAVPGFPFLPCQFRVGLVIPRLPLIYTLSIQGVAKPRRRF